MSEWKEYKLGDLADITSSKRIFYSDYVMEGIPFFRSKEIIERSLGESGGEPLYISREKFTEIKNSFGSPVDGDLLISAVGERAGIPYVVKNQGDFYFKDGNLIWLRNIKAELNPTYLNYWIKSSIGQYTLESIMIGSAQKALTIVGLKNLGVTLPSSAYQSMVVDTLSSLDDKIDLLQRQNKTLEQLAETLFRQWFVEEAKESWEVAKLGDVAIVQNGYAFSSRDYVPFQDGYLEVLKMGHIAVGGGLRTNPKKDFVPREEKLKRWTLNKNDIIMGMTDMKDNVVILGVPAMIDKSDKYVLNQRVARIYLEANKKLLNSYLLYIQLNNKEFIATLQGKANSGVQVNLSTEVIKDCDILIPPMELQKEKGNMIAEFYFKKENNDIQIKSLTQLRDTLLPKLMSGELRVNN